MSRASEYRRKAMECAETARLLSDRQARMVMTEVALKWMAMAERVEKDESASRNRDLGRRLAMKAGETQTSRQSR